MGGRCKIKSENVVVNIDVIIFNKSMIEITAGSYKILCKVTKICLET